MNIVPQILSPAGTSVPDKHASRVVGELCQLLIAESNDQWGNLIALWARGADGNPKAQHRLVERIERQRVRSILKLRLTPGKRGKYHIVIIDWGGWDSSRDAEITSRDPMPPRPWLVVRLSSMEGRGRGQIDSMGCILALISHHALVRLVQRFDARTADDLASAARIVWEAIFNVTQEEGLEGIGRLYGEAPPAGWRIPFGDGGALILARHDTSQTLILKTVLGPGMADDTAAA
jgi:hypothetical protein